MKIRKIYEKKKIKKINIIKNKRRERKEKRGTKINK